MSLKQRLRFFHRRKGHIFSLFHFLYANVHTTVFLCYQKFTFLSHIFYPRCFQCEKKNQQTDISRKLQFSSPRLTLTKKKKNENIINYWNSISPSLTFLHIHTYLRIVRPKIYCFFSSSMLFGEPENKKHPHPIWEKKCEREEKVSQRVILLAYAPPPPFYTFVENKWNKHSCATSWK